MHVVVIHRISEPERFWTAAQQTTLPAGVVLHLTLPTADGATAVCHWEATTMNAVREVVEGLAPGSSANEYFQVDAANARGLS